MKKTLTLLIFLLATAFNSSRAQDNYFYTSFKLPLSDYIVYLVKKTPSDETDGVLMDVGYRIKVNRLLAVETGIEYFIFNPYEKGYYRQPTDLDPYAELHVRNSAFSFQARPVLKIPFDPDDNTSFKVGYAVNYSKTFSSGYYYANPQSSQYAIEDRTDSDFFLAFQPSMGLEFSLSQNWRLGLDLNYVRMNWNNSMSKLEFPGVSNFVTPGHKTSTVFMVGRILFK